MSICANPQSLHVLIAAALLAILPCAQAPAQGIPASQPASLSVRVPVPSAAAQASAQKAVRDTFGDAAQVAPDKRVDLAKQLLAQGRDIGNDAASRYVLLKQTIELATRARDAAIAMDAASEMATHFVVDGEQLKLDTLRECFAPSMAPEQAAAVANQCIRLNESAMKSDRSDVADRALILAESADHIARQPELTALVATHRRDMNRQKSAAASAEAAERRLKNNPDDPGADFARGFYLAVVKEDWNAGLPLLAKGENVPFKAAALRDLANPSKPDAMVTAGDGWWDLSQNETGAIQSSLRKRAAFWYLPLDKLASFTGLGRTRLEKRLAELAAATAPSGAAVVPTPTGPSLLSPRSRKVALFIGNEKEEPIFRDVSGGDMEVIKRADRVAKLQDPLLWSSNGIIVWGVGSFQELPVPDLTPAVLENMRQFVGAGGDLVLFEQSEHDKTGIISNLFGVKSKGGPFAGTQILIRDLLQRAVTAGYTPSKLATIQFANGYELPRGSLTLTRDGKGRIATTAVVPFGRGHLILVGTNLSPEDLKLDEVLFQYLYGTVPSDTAK